MRFSTALLALTPALASPVIAQVPQPPPAPPRSAAHPAPRAPVQSAPVQSAPVQPTPGQPSSNRGATAKPPTRPAPTIGPKPGAPGHRPTRPAAHPPAPAPAPVPAPAPEPEKPAEPQKGSNTGMPLPRFAALRSEEVNLRTGPGVRYPIEWVYKRRDLPVQIEREFEVWRLVRDQEGVKGWVHQATLAPRRTAVVVGGEQTLRQSAEDASAPVAKLKAGVILRLRSCEATSNWCQAQVGDYRGWIKRTDIWGTYPNEAIQ